MLFKLKKLFSCTLLLLSLSCVNVYASSPVVFMQSLGDHMVVALSKQQSQLRSNPSVIPRIVDRVLIPHVDVNRMAGMTVGRNHWYKASDNQRRLFVRLYKRMVVQTYADALASFDNDTVKVFPLRGSAKGVRYLKVNSVIIRKTGQKIGISYNLVRSGSGWKIYDFSIEGVSVVSNYRAQFYSVLSQGGLSKLNAQLQRYQRGVR